MNGKKSPIIIAILLVLIVVVLVVAMFIFKKDSEVKQQEYEQAQSVPEITLTLSSEEADQDSVKIIVEVTTEDPEGISTITLPDRTSISGVKAEYEVTENGIYVFGSTGFNGKYASAKIEVSNIRKLSAENPYVPEGFDHIGGDVNNGYVISDKVGNQFVWVPVPNGILTRNTMLNTNFEDQGANATELVNSVAKYYGFYIARFEACQYDLNGTIVAASMAGKTPWRNIDFDTAFQAAADMSVAFGYPKDVTTSLINSYAWDTVLEWIDKTVTGYSSSTNFGNYGSSFVKTGETKSDIVLNVCDLAGNVREWTTEKDKSQVSAGSTVGKGRRVVRGGGATLSRPASGHTGYEESTTNVYWGFRAILYK
jgi:hypothetical protein